MMKRPFATWLVVAVMSVAGGFPIPTQAQSPRIEGKSDALNATPGLYVDGRSAFTVSYPKEWVVQTTQEGESFRVGRPRGADFPPTPVLVIYEFQSPADVGTVASVFAAMTKRKNVNVLFSKPLKLQDGTAAHEAEMEWPIPFGPATNTFLVATRKEGSWILVAVSDVNGAISEELKRIGYSLRLLPDGDGPGQARNAETAR